MRDKLRRQRRTVAAQVVLVRLVESRLQSEQHRLGKLQHNRSELIASLDRLVSGFVSYPTIMRKLSRLDAEIHASDGRIAMLMTDLIKAKSVHETLNRHCAESAYVVERKEGDEETREISLAMRKTASHKDTVLD